MATTLYFRVGTVFTGLVNTEFSHQDYSTDLLTGGPQWSPDSLSTTAGTASPGYTFGSTNSSSGPLTFPGDKYYNAISPPVASEVTISGTVSLNYWAKESSMSANYTWAAAVWVIRTNGTWSLIGSKSYGTEITTSAAEYSTTLTPTQTTLYPGDVIKVGFFWDDATSVTGASGYTLNGYMDGVTYNSYISFTENISFLSEPSGTTTNLLYDNSDISGTQNKKMWTDTSSTGTFNTSTVLNPNIAQFTITAGGTQLQWFTPQLNSVSIVGYVKLVYTSQITNGGISTMLVRLYKTDGNGNNPVYVGSVRGRSNSTISSTERTTWGHVNASISSGERLKVVAYTSSTGANQYQNSGHTFTLNLGSSINNYIQWPATLSLYSPSVPKFRSVPSVAVSQSSRW